MQIAIKLRLKGSRNQPEINTVYEFAQFAHGIILVINGSCLAVTPLSLHLTNVPKATYYYFIISKTLHHLVFGVVNSLRIA